MNKYISQYKHTQQTKLRNMHKKSPKDYWKYLNSLNKSKKTKTPPIESLHDFFRPDTRGR